LPQLPQSRGPRINRQIRISPIRLIDHEGNQVGIIDTFEAIKMAEEVGMDLVEVSPEARPPVCKLIDLGRHN
jgi:translation initiation factor IF-3